LTKGCESIFVRFIDRELPVLVNLDSGIEVEDLIQDLYVHFLYTKKIYSDKKARYYKEYIYKSLKRRAINLNILFRKKKKEFENRNIEIDSKEEDYYSVKKHNDIKHIEQQDLFLDEALDEFRTILTPIEKTFLTYLLAGCSDDFAKQEGISDVNARQIKSRLVKKISCRED
jgi:hypothetical protein